MVLSSPVSIANAWGSFKVFGDQIMSQGKLIVLGSGTSLGTPVIGCTCNVCQSNHPKNFRTRSSIFITLPNQKIILIDSPPDLRTQLLREKISTVDAIFFTHTHADHCHGFDDLRTLHYNKKEPIHCYGSESDLKEIKRRFHYAFEDTGYHAARPDLTLTPFPSHQFSLFDHDIEILSLEHGHMMTSAFRIGKFAYATDFKKFSEEQIQKWRGKIHTMLASGLRYRPHSTHSSIDETLKLFDQLNVERGIITHVSHDVDYEEASQKLPSNRLLAYDGFHLEIIF